MKELNKKILKGLKWTVFRSGGEEAVQLIVFIILARLLKPEDFGLVAMAGIFVGFLNLFADQGFGSAIIQKKEITREHLDSSFWVNFGISLILFLSIYLSSDIIASFFDEQKLSPVLQLLSIGFMVNAMGMIPNSVLSKNLSFKILAIRSVVASLIGGVTGIMFAYLDFGVYSIVAYKLVTSFVAVLTVWWLVEWRPSFNFSYRHIRELWSFGFYITLSKFITNSHEKSFDGLIGYFLGAEVLGYFTIAKKVASHINSILAKTTARVLFPIFSEQQEDIKGINNSFNLINTQLIGFTMPFLLFLSLNSNFLITKIFGEQWNEAAIIFSIFNLWIFVFIQRVLFKQTLLSTGDAHYFTKFSVLNFITCVLFVYLVIDLSWEAIAFAYVLALTISFPMLIYKASIKNIISIKPYFKSFIPGFVNLLLFIFVNFVFVFSNLLGEISNVVVSVLSLAVVYLIYVWINRDKIHKIFKASII